ncbi:DUF4865 family protein [Streptomyces sp. NPDC050504]|uniref:DUF4865 family protein n=1 Tax=Streptomyces sp. NPDC050504 TaxID=3365618 RepID=UPI0037A0A6EA
MHAMQYEITLPADYDMRIIRERVAAKGHLLDGLPGLGLKAYLVRERGDASPVNQYAPFYLWHDPAAMTGFLRGPGFQGLSADFGRPAVRNWQGVGYAEGGGDASGTRTAVRRTQPVEPFDPVAQVVDEALRESVELARESGAVCTALALDPYRWELVHFSLWDHDAPTAPGDRYEVLHLSRGSER